MASLIEQLYQQELGRAPEAEGLNYWTNLMNSGWTADDLRAAINASPEAQIYDARQQQIGNAAPAMTSRPTLTPEIASNLMQRSMTTGVPTSEFEKYGGYDKVSSLYNQNNGTYSLNDLDPAFLKNAANIIANTGVGAMNLLAKTNTPLTEAGRQAMINNGISWTDADLKAMNIPYEGFLKVQTNTPTNQIGTGGTGGTQSNTSSPVYGGSLTSWQEGAAGNERLGAGNADYQSDLIRNLRAADNSIKSANTGVTKYGYEGSRASGTPNFNLNNGGAFNPQVFENDAATADQIANWDAYNTYRVNMINNKQPYGSFTDWLAAKNPTSDGTSKTSPPIDQFWLDGSVGGGV